MLRRVEEVCRIDTRRISGGTFHHVAHQVLREHAGELGYRRGYSILDREDSRDVMSAAIADCGLAVGARRFPKADVLIDLVSMAVNTQTPLAEVLADRRPQFVPLTDDVLRVARRYAERKHALNAMDFDDLLLNWKILLAEREHVRKRALAGRYRHVLVDEYQDTNRLQGDVVDLIAGEHRNLCVVGDDAQSIYSFRGAHFANILEFEQRYPDARRFDLTVNYRSTPQILALANASIAANVRQFEKELESVRRDGTLPAVVPVPRRPAAGRLRGAARARAARRGDPAPRDCGAVPRAPPLDGDPVRAGAPRDPLRGPQRRPLLRGRTREGRARTPALRPEPRRRAGAEALPQDHPRGGHRHRRGGLERLRARRSHGRGTVEELLAPDVAVARAGQGPCRLHPARPAPPDALPARPPATCPARPSSRCWRAATRST